MTIENPLIENMVKGWGPEVCEVMLVSDYPTKDELSQKRAFSGYLGNLVGTYLKDAGYDINKCFKTCYVKTPLSMPRNKKLRIKALEQAREDVKPADFDKLLSNEILEVNPNVIVSVGEICTNYLTGRRNNIHTLRGSVLPLSDIARMNASKPADIKPNIRVIPTLHARDIAKKWQANAYVPIDYQRAIKHRTRLDKFNDEALIWICRDGKSLINWWNDRGCKAKFLTLDIETYNGFVTCISFCGDGKEALSVPLIDKRINALERALMFKYVYIILQSKVPKVNQNILYDHHMLEYWGFDVVNVAGDTMLLSHVLFPELPRGLDFLTSIYTDIPYYKDDGRDFNPKQGWDVLYTYNAKDSLSAWQIYEKQLGEADELNVKKFYLDYVMPSYHMYKRMMDRGIRVDETEQHVLNMKYVEVLNVHFQSLRKLSNNPDINFNSPKQINKLVYDELKLPPQYKNDPETGGKRLTADEETLEELALNHAPNKEISDILWEIIWCRKVYKLLTYINLAVHPDGRARANPKISGTKSGRTSMSETVDRLWYFNTPDHPWYDKHRKSSKVLTKELGLSFQTFPKHGIEVGTQTIGKDARRIFVPSPGYSFVEGDGGQAEARVVAILAEDYTALDEMERKNFVRNAHGIKDDIHTKTTMLVLDLLFDAVTEADRQDFGKKPRHAGNYDMGPARLALMAHIPLAKAITVLSKFHAISPKIREVFHTTIRTVVTNSRSLSTLHGRQRQFFDKLTPETFKQAFSYIPQAVVSDHTKYDTGLPLNDWSKDFAYFLSESHDSLFYEVKNELVMPFAGKFKLLEEQPLIFNQGTFIRERPLVIPCEIKVGENNWYEMKEIKLAA